MATVAQLEAEVQVVGAVASSAQLAGFGKQIDATAAKQGLAATKSASHDQALRKVGTAGLVAGGLLVAGFGVAVGAATSFDKEMSGVAAVANVSAKGMDNLRDAAIEAGAATAFSAGEAAEAEAELAKAGVGVSDILGGALRGSLDLAAAGQLALADAATITAQSLNIFELSGGKASHVADVLTAGANKAAAEVADLGQGLQSVGNIANTAGISLEETVGTLALFSQNALNGERAGTTLRSMLVSLQAPTTEAREMMDELGIAAFDNQGEFVGLAGFAGQLQTALSGLTDEQRAATLATLFSTFGLNAANILYKEGEAGVRKWTEAVDDQGAASRFAGVQLDNLSGDFEQLRGSIETALIQGGSGATDALRTMTQGAVGLVNGIGSLPPVLQTAGVGFAGISGATLLAGGALAMIVRTAGSAKQALLTLSSVSKISVGALGVLGLALTAGAIALSIWGKRKADAKRKIEEFSAALQADNGVIAKNTRELLKNQLQERNQINDLNDIGIKFRVWTDAVDGNTRAQRKIRRAMVETGEVTVRGAESTDAAAEALRGWIRTGDDQGAMAANMMIGNLGLVGSLQSQTAAAEASKEKNRELEESGADVGTTSAEAAGGVDELTGATAELGSEAEEAAEQLEELKGALDEILGVTLSAEQAQIRWGDSLAGVAEAVLENGLTLDVNTDAGRRNRDAILGAVEAAKVLAEGMIDQGVATDFASATLGAEIEQLAGVMRQLGWTEDQVVSYFENLLKIPESARTDITNTSDIARYIVGLYQASLDEIAPEMTTTFIAETAAAEAKIARLKESMRGLGSTGRLYSTLDRLGQLEGSAAGGPVKAGVAGFVGEKGIELFVPDVDGTIVPNDVLRNSIPAPAPIAVTPPGFAAPPPAPAAGGGTGASSTRTVTNNYEFSLQSLDPRELAHATLNEIALTELARAGDL